MKFIANIAFINLTVSILNTNEIPFVSFEYYIIPYPPTEEKIAFLFPLRFNFCMRTGIWKFLVGHRYFGILFGFDGC